jgi:hypothetical protein
MGGKEIKTAIVPLLKGHSCYRYAIYLFFPQINFAVFDHLRQYKQ